MGTWSYKAQTNVGWVGVLGGGFLSDLHIYDFRVLNSPRSEHKGP